MRTIGLILILSLIAAPAYPVTAEAVSLPADTNVANFWQEADITFWQTLPFATLWCHFADRQASTYMFPGSETHWEAVLVFATIISVSNALFHASEVMGQSEAQTL
ncbi:hypothetical protein ACFL1W_00805 [Candidatus Margulisiibacteriota bacterium]